MAWSFAAAADTVDDHHQLCLHATRCSSPAPQTDEAIAGRLQMCRREVSRVLVAGQNAGLLLRQGNTTRLKGGRDGGAAFEALLADLLMRRGATRRAEIIDMAGICAQDILDRMCRKGSIVAIQTNRGVAYNLHLYTAVDPRSDAPDKPLWPAQVRFRVAGPARVELRVGDVSAATARRLPNGWIIADRHPQWTTSDGHKQPQASLHVIAQQVAAFVQRIKETP